MADTKESSIAPKETQDTQKEVKKILLQSRKSLNKLSTLNPFLEVLKAS